MGNSEKEIYGRFRRGGRRHRFKYLREHGQEGSGKGGWKSTEAKTKGEGSRLAIWVLSMELGRVLTQSTSALKGGYWGKIIAGTLGDEKSG